MNKTSMGSKKPNRKVMKRIGLTKQVCMSCNASAPENANKCRKCGKKNLRQKKSEFSN